MEKTITPDKQIDVPRFAKYMAIVVGTIGLSNPVELIKTRMQVSPEHLFRGTITQPYQTITETAKRIIK